MGLLSLGTPLPWEEAKKHADHVRKHGIVQFLNIWNRIKTRRKDHLLWGDEIEYIVVKYNDEEKGVKVSLHAHDALEKLQVLELDHIAKGEVFESSWKPEYGRYMLEGTPGLPYGYTLDDILGVEENMIRRRRLATSMLRPGEAVLTLTNFPRLGSCGFTDPPSNATPDAGASMSFFIPNEAINPHARFPTLTANIRLRRGSKVAINMPIYKDKNTPSPWREPNPSCLTNHCTKSLPAAIAAGCSNGHAEETAEAVKKLNKDSLPSLPDLVPDALPDHIYMDAMCFGMGCCCLQVTFQACSVEEARLLYDQLAVVTPIMMALSAGAPIFRGYLADVDCRWNVISGSVDDRTIEERGLKPLEHSKFRIKKSRYDSISNYLSPGPMYSGGCNTPDVANIPLEKLASIPSKGMEFYKDEYNDLDTVYDKDIYRQLVDGGVDDLLAKHYAHLFIRDPLVVFQELLEQDDELSSDHFENIQSTNWQSMRFKPPPPSAPHIGWRVEFRSMEIQLTDHENAAFSIFVVLLVRAILSFDLNLYIPLSKVDENMQRAHSRDAVHREKFWFRRNCIGDPNRKLGDLGCKCPRVAHQTVAEAVYGAPYVNGVDHGNEDAYEEMTVNEIMNGKPSTNFIGLTNLVRRYLHIHQPAISEATRTKLEAYIDVISRKASGELKTSATWIRDFVAAHPGYKGDSVVSEEVAYDLCKAVENLAEKRVEGLNC
ncbi:glutamate---cysteine ligase [Powellomyces hirtus]|uniref:Glutamate--cysteine ligase n=1 Tax=Powellomyces hirtus TaxID=109895 RepID=A0A507EGS8_9FUNG|nr:glutamate---cysteine ligase [Powellomyces hirtus]